MCQCSRGVEGVEGAVWVDKMDVVTLLLLLLFVENILLWCRVTKAADDTSSSAFIPPRGTSK